MDPIGCGALLFVGIPGLIFAFLLLLHGANPATSLNRMGIVLQLFAGLSVVPEILPKQWRTRLESLLKRIATRPRTGRNWLFALVVTYVLFMPMILGAIVLWQIAPPNDTTPYFVFLVLLILTPVGGNVPGILLRTIARILNVGEELGLTQLMLRVTFPLFFLGTLMQLIATWVS